MTNQDTTESAARQALSLYRPEALEAMALKQGISGQPVISPTPAIQLLVLTLLLMTVTVLALATSGRYSSKTQVSGYLEHVQPATRLRAQQAGEVHRLLVRNGDFVAAKQPLLILRPASMSHSGSRLQQDMLELLADHQEDREAANATLERQFELERLKLLEARGSLNARLLHTRELLKLERSKAVLLGHKQTALQELHEQGHLGVLDWLEVQTEVLNSGQQLASLQSRVEQLQSDLLINEKELEERQLAGLLERETAMSAVVSLEQQRLQLRASTELVVRAPADGVVQLLQVYPGQELIQGQVMLMVRAQEVRLRAVLAVPASAAGRVYPGQEIELEVTAFPQAGYGTLSALVTSVSDQAQLPQDWLAPIAVTEPSYLVHVSFVPSAVAANIHLKAGMTLLAYLPDTPRSLFSWLLGPALRVL